MWPIAVAPYDAHIVSLGTLGSEEAADEAERVHRSLQVAGGAEMKRRDGEEKSAVPGPKIVARVRAELDAMRAALK